MAKQFHDDPGAGSVTLCTTLATENYLEMPRQLKNHVQI